MQWQFARLLHSTPSPGTFSWWPAAILDKIRAGYTERNLAGVPDLRELRGHGADEGVHREQQIEIARQLFAAMGFPDDSLPANAVISKHKSVDEAVVFTGFN